MNMSNTSCDGNVWFESIWYHNCQFGGHKKRSKLITKNF